MGIHHKLLLQTILDHMQLQRINSPQANWFHHHQHIHNGVVDMWDDDPSVAPKTPGPYDGCFLSVGMPLFLIR